METPTIQSVLSFSEVVAVLESLYRKGMTGWGKKHSTDIEAAISSTGLHLTQIKVMRAIVSGLHILALW